MVARRDDSLERVVIRWSVVKIVNVIERWIIERVLARASMRRDEPDGDADEKCCDGSAEVPHAS